MFPLTSAVPVVIIAPPGRLRDALTVLLRAENRIVLAGEADDLASGLQMVAEHAPVLVLANSSELGERALVELGRLKTRCQLRFIALVHNRDQAQHARVNGADAVLVEGFTSEDLSKVIKELMVSL